MTSRFRARYDKWLWLVLVGVVVIPIARAGFFVATGHLTGVFAMLVIAGVVVVPAGKAASGPKDQCWRRKRFTNTAERFPGVDTSAWRTGRALILVHLVDAAGTMQADAILEIGCRLPGNPGVSGTVEGIRLLIGGGLNFNEPADPKLACLWAKWNGCPACVQ